MMGRLQQQVQGALRPASLCSSTPLPLSLPSIHTPPCPSQQWLEPAVCVHAALLPPPAPLPFAALARPAAAVQLLPRLHFAEQAS